MRILVTGSSGFIGQNLLAYLSHCNCEILCKEKLRTVSPDSIKGKDVIIHLAGKAHDLKKTLAPKDYYDINFELTRKLYDAFLLSDVKKFIFMSSVKAIADAAAECLSEDVMPDPHTDYGKSKLMAEQYIQAQPLPEWKTYYILRPSMVHGPGNKGNLNLLYKFVKSGLPYPLAGFNNKRSFLSVQNLCFVINELIGRDDIAGGVYHISDDQALSTNEVVSVLASSLKKVPKLWRMPPSIIRNIVRICDYLHLPLTTERLNKLTENYVVSNKKLKSALNKAFPLTAFEGLRICADSFGETDNKK